MRLFLPIQAKTNRPVSIATRGHRVSQPVKDQNKQRENTPDIPGEHCLPEIEASLKNKSEPAQNKENSPDISTQSKRTAGFGYNLGIIPILPPLFDVTHTPETGRKGTPSILSRLSSISLTRKLLGFNERVSLGHSVGKLPDPSTKERQKDFGRILNSNSNTLHSSPAVSAKSVMDRATSGMSAEVPYRTEMERAFNEDFSHVASYSGRAIETASLGAHAATRGESIVFAEDHPSREVVAHELVHILQNRTRFNPLNSNGGITPSNHPAEREAETLATQVITGKPVTFATQLGGDISLQRFKAGDIVILPDPPGGKGKVLSIQKGPKYMIQILGGKWSGQKKIFDEDELSPNEEEIEPSSVSKGMGSEEEIAQSSVSEAESSPVSKPAAVERRKPRKPKASAVQPATTRTSEEEGSEVMGSVSSETYDFNYYNQQERIAKGNKKEQIRKKKEEEKAFVLPKLEIGGGSKLFDKGDEDISNVFDTSIKQYIIDFLTGLNVTYNQGDLDELHEELKPILQNYQETIKLETQENREDVKGGSHINQHPKFVARLKMAVFQWTTKLAKDNRHLRDLLREAYSNQKKIADQKAGFHFGTGKNAW
jgi:hypothetical protein